MRRVEDLLRATAEAEARHFWFRGFRAFITPLVIEATSGRTNVRILDCGCGTGANLALLGRFGRAYGFDLSEAGLRLGREAGRTRLTRASVTAVPFPTAAFDLVTSFDVLYSLQSPDERTAVKEMYRLIRPGGYALINVAALEMLRGDHSVLSREVRRYSRDALRALLSSAGFAIERITYTNTALFLPMALMRAMQRLRGLSNEREAQREISVPRAPINAMLSGVLLLESLWVRRFDSPFGSSLLCLAKKPA
jgi:ubiquinone/menaquinone biosynthesis C-methylase UbiE